MRKKSLTVVLTLAILLTFTGSAFSGWGPKTNNFGPIVMDPAPAHPWGDSGRSIYTPSCNRPGSGGGLPDLSPAPTFTNFVLQFYFKYVVKKQMEEQRSTQRDERRD